MSTGSLFVSNHAGHFTLSWTPVCSRDILAFLYKLRNKHVCAPLRWGMDYTALLCSNVGSK